METSAKCGRFALLEPACLVYALFYTFCLYENPSGITFFFLCAGTLLLTHLTAEGKQAEKSGQKSEIYKKAEPCEKVEYREKIVGRSGIFYPVAMLLLGVSTFMTDSSPVIALNHAAEAVLLIFYLIRLNMDDGSMEIGDYLTALIKALFGSLLLLFAPFQDAAGYFEERKGNASGKKGLFRPILAGLLIAVPLLAVITALLSSADRIFAVMLENTFGKMTLPENLPFIAVMAVFAFFASYCGISYFRKEMFRETGNRQPDQKKNPVAAITFTGLILIVYFIFIGIQAAFLIAGNGILPEGTTYAEYVHQGFYQLLAVSIINLVLVMVCEAVFQRCRLLSGLLAGISVSTYCMMAVSAGRMILYIRAGVMIKVFRPDFRFFRYSLFLTVSMYLVFSFARPDAWIAEYNLSAGNEDYFYYGTLSADAAPVFFKNVSFMSDPDRRSAYTSALAESLRTKNPGDFRTFNISRAEASGLLKLNR